MKKIVHFLLNLIGALFVFTIILIGIGLIYLGKKGSLDFDGLKEAKSVQNIVDWYRNETTEELFMPEVVNVESVSYDRYAYQQLNKEEQYAYDQIYDCIDNHTDKITLSTKDKDVLAVAYEAVMADYGGLFWVSGYQYNTYTSNKNVVGLEFEPKYTMSKDQRNVYQAKIDDVAEDWLSGISMSDSDFDKALYVFETLIEKVDYDTNSEENQNILSVFLYQKTVCQGYADAAWYLLEKLGISSTIVTGTANNESHAWNLVHLDGAYYFMDVTWGNSKYLNSNNDTTKRVNYAYLAMTTEEISQNHIITASFEIPECLSNADDYFVHNGLYYETYAVDAIGAKLRDSYNADESEISLKFSNSDLYGRVITYFFEEKHISDYCIGLTEVYYLLDENANVITVRWK